MANIHILGICGTFMAGLAVLAKAQGHVVSGSDEHAYPPMSTQLEAQGIKIDRGYSADYLRDHDLIIVGNVISRGNPAIEYVLNHRLSYVSGPEWLAHAILCDRHILAVAGTHGKTTTSSMLAWILEYAGLEPGFLIGGVANNFGVSARLGKAPFFVIEADEYDSAFFDKRSKFVHYRPRTLILNNLEFDHADIFDDLDSIKRQFHHLVRTVPSEGVIIVDARDDNLKAVLQQGCWTEVEEFASSSRWHAEHIEGGGNKFEVYCGEERKGEINWSVMGEHNIHNALAAIIAAQQAGVHVATAMEALQEFKSVKRRMELKECIDGITLYDDFAHHPTAIKTTLKGLRAQVQDHSIFVILDVGTHTMRMGVHQETLPAALQEATEVFIVRKENIKWDLETLRSNSFIPISIFENTNELIGSIKHKVESGDVIIVMSNSGFNEIHDELISMLSSKQ